MSAYNDLVNRIGKEIEGLHVDALGGVIFDNEEILRLPLFEEPYEPPIDIVSETEIDPETIEQIYERKNLLGISSPMTVR